MTKLINPLSGPALLCLTGNIASATIIGFGGTQGSNASIDASNGLWSNATADVEGLTVSNGATPNIAIAFDAGWDYHNTPFFGVVEAQTPDTDPYDNNGTDPDIAQVEGQEIAFTVDPGFALVLNSFDFGLSSETPDEANIWTISIFDSSGEAVWSETVGFSNVETGGLGDVKTITPNFTGLPGENYVLHFNLDQELGSQNYGGLRNAIDNLSFNQIDASQIRPEVTQVKIEDNVFEISVTGLNPSKSYHLKRGTDLVNFPETIMTLQPSESSAVFIDELQDSAAGTKAFYRVEEAE